MKKNNIYIAFILITLLAVSCSVPKDLQVNEKVNLPEKFKAAQNDSSKVILSNWKEFFKDKLLVALIDSALVNNPDMKIAYQRLYFARSNFKVNRNLLFPTLNADARIGVTRFGDYTIDGVGNFDTNFSQNINEDQRIPNPVPDFLLGFSSNWEIGIFGKIRNRKKAAFYKMLASEQGKHLITTQLVAEVARQYYELLSVDTEVEILRNNIDLQEKAFEIIEIQKQSGRINELAVKQFQAQLLHAKTMEAIKIQEQTALENNLNYLLGRYPQKINRKDTIEISDLPETLKTGVPSELLKNRPDVMMAEKEWLAGKAELKSAKAAFYPSININANYGVNAFKSALLFNTPASIAYVLVGSITNPLLNRQQIMAAYKYAFTQKNEAFLNYQKTLLKSVEEVNTELSRYKNYEKAAAYKQEEVKTMKEAVAISNELFLTGYANYMEVLMTRQSRLESELALTQARKELFIASINLYKALGGGWK
jgi:NodT family efflux transporter outer membrane factor (OMF) lipoprotein